MSLLLLKVEIDFFGFLLPVRSMYGEFRDENTSKWKVACVACRDG